MDDKAKALIIILLGVTFLSIGISLFQYLDLESLLDSLSSM
ncbi:MAG: hypothetical protein ACTSUE_25750 [Promethearchaeota archaeon]